MTDDPASAVLAALRELSPDDVLKVRSVSKKVNSSKNNGA